MPVEPDIESHWTEALRALDGALFDHRVDLDLTTLERQAAILDHAPSPAWKARAAFLRARLALLGGQYSRALASMERAFPGLEPEHAATLRSVTAFCRLARYAQGGALHYDEDVRLALGNEILHRRPEGDYSRRVFDQATALHNRSVMLATLAISPQGTPFLPLAKQVHSELESAFCPGAGTDCPEAALLFLRLLGLVGHAESGIALAQDIAIRFDRIGRRALAGLALLWGADLCLSPRSSPYDLALHSLASADTKTALNAGLQPAEFARTSPAAIDRGRALLESARHRFAQAGSARGNIECEVRIALLTWLRDDYAQAAETFAHCAQRFDQLLDRRQAYRCRVALLIVAAVRGSEPRELVPLLRAHSDVDEGWVLAALSLLERAALFVQHRLGDAHVALQLRAAAIDLAETDFARHRRARLLSEQGSLLGSLGQHESAVRSFEQSLALGRELANATTVTPTLGGNHSRLEEYDRLLGLIQNLMALADRSAEDLRRARDANRRLLELGQTGTVHGPAMAASNEVLLALQAGEREEALALAQKYGERQHETMILAMLGRVAEVTSRIEADAQRLLPLLEQLRNAGSGPDRLRLQIARAEFTQSLTVLLRAKQFALAEELLNRAEQALNGTLFSDLSQRFEQPYVLAQIAAGRGRLEEALVHYREAIVLLDEHAERVALTQSRTRVDAATTYIRAAYVSFLLRPPHTDGAEIARGDAACQRSRVAEGLVELERYRAAEFQRNWVLAAATRRRGERLLREWRSAEARAELLARQLHAAGDVSESARAELEAAQAQVRTTRKAVAESLGSAETNKAVFDGLMPALEQRIRASETTLLTYHLHGDQSSVTVLRPNEPPHAVALPLRDFELRPEVVRLLSDLNTGRVEWQREPQVLYERLVAPIRDWLPKPSAPGVTPRLGIVAFGDAHQIPFHLLLDRGRPLIQSYDLFYVPSLLSFVHGPQAPARSGAVRALGYNGQILTHAETEAATLDPSAVLGERSTRVALLELFAQPGIIHVAAHATLNNDNPFLSAIHLADGALALHELRGREMRAELVVLSACDTGRGERSRADQLTGLTTTFIENGVPAVIATGWRIDDLHVLPIVHDFYAELRRVTPLAALNAAQRRAAGKRGDRMPPHYWAAFYFTGVAV